LPRKGVLVAIIACEEKIMVGNRASDPLLVGSLVVLCFAFVIPCDLLAVGPTHENVAYGTHERMKLDVWLAKSDKPTPIVVWFHGGGFVKGDKNSVRRDPVIRDCLAQGISFASCNYPYVENRDYLRCLANTELAIKHIRKMSGDWNLDAGKIAVAGASAGALTSEYLICEDRKLSAAAAFMQPKGTDLLVLPRMKRGGQPVFVYQRSGDDDEVHHPRYARMLKRHCDSKKIPCEVFGSDKNDLPKLPAGVSSKQAMVAFLMKVWDKGGTQVSRSRTSSLRERHEKANAAWRKKDAAGRR